MLDLLILMLSHVVVERNTRGVGQLRTRMKQKVFYAIRVHQNALDRLVRDHVTMGNMHLLDCFVDALI